MFTNTKYFFGPDMTNRENLKAISSLQQTGQYIPAYAPYNYVQSCAMGSLNGFVHDNTDEGLGILLALIDLLRFKNPFNQYKYYKNRVLATSKKAQRDNPKTYAFCNFGGYVASPITYKHPIISGSIGGFGQSEADSLKGLLYDIGINASTNYITSKLSGNLKNIGINVPYMGRLTNKLKTKRFPQKIIDFIENLPYNISDYFIDNALQNAIRNSPYYYNKEEDTGHE